MIERWNEIFGKYLKNYTPNKKKLLNGFLKLKNYESKII